MGACYYDLMCYYGYAAIQWDWDTLTDGTEPESCEDQGLVTCDDGSCAATADDCTAAACTDCQGQDCTGYEGWIGDGWCDDGAWGFYFNCAEFDCDAGDCTADQCDGSGGGDGGGSEDCASCEFDWTAYGSECCDTAWAEFGITSVSYTHLTLPTSDLV